MSLLVRSGLATIFLLGAVGIGGCGKPDPGTGMDPENMDGAGPGEGADMRGGGGGTASATISPLQMFAGREGVLEIAGKDTHFGAGSTVAFDDREIAAGMIEVIGPDRLRVPIRSGEGAKLGAHEVTVTTPGAGASGGDERVVAQGFTLMKSMAYEVSGAAPSVVQGGVVSLTLANLDELNPFAMGLAGGETSRTIGMGMLTEKRYVGGFLADPLAPVGSTLRAVLTGPDAMGKSIKYLTDPADPGAPQVTARAPTALTLGVAKSGESIPVPMRTNLYKFTTPAADHVVTMTYTGVGTPLTLAGIIGVLTPASGRLADGSLHVASKNSDVYTAVGVAAQAGDQYLITLPGNLSGASVYTYTLTVRSAAGKRISLLEPAMPDNQARPLADIPNLDMPYFGTDGAIDGTGDGDVDFIRFKASKTGRVYVHTANNLNSPPYLDLYAMTCTGMAMATGSSGGLEANVTAGTGYCVRVSGFAPRRYQFVITH